MITIRGVIAAESADDVYKVVDQVARDATTGSFERFPPFWDDRWETPPHELFGIDNVRDLKGGRYEFHISVNSSLFPIRQGGLQHLVGVLAGDTFYPYHRGHVPDIQIIEVGLPGSYTSEAHAAYRMGRANSIHDIRAIFNLDEYAPLIAFSFKPRVGVTFKALEEVTLGVLKAGFHIVELDTRNLIRDDETAKQLVELAAKAAALPTGHVTRFSPNLTLPAEKAVKYGEWFYEAHEGPVVIKVDGALDGISTCQAIRTHWRNGGGESAKPIVITSYPLLRTVFDGRVPRECYNNMLALSGVDIMYPGNRPSLGFDAKRQLDTAKVTNLLGSL